MKVESLHRNTNHVRVTLSLKEVMILGDIIKSQTEKTYADCLNGVFIEAPRSEYDMIAFKLRMQVRQIRDLLEMGMVSAVTAKEIDMYSAIEKAFNSKKFEKEFVEGA